MARHLTLLPVRRRGTVAKGENIIGEHLQFGGLAEVAGQGARYTLGSLRGAGHTGNRLLI